MSNKYIFNIDPADGKPYLEAVNINGHFEICLVKQSERAIEYFLSEHGGDLYRYLVQHRMYECMTVSAVMGDNCDGWLVSFVEIICRNENEYRQERLHIYGKHQVSYEVARGDSNE